MKTCTVCNTRQHDELVGDDGKCTEETLCLANRKRMKADLAELCQGLINISQAIYGWQQRCAGYAVESGFRQYDWPASRENVATFVANLHSEVCELWEAFREGKLHAPCAKASQMNELGLPVLTCAEEELADVFIRLMDTAEALGVNMPKAIAAKHALNTTRSYQHGGKLA